MTKQEARMELSKGLAGIYGLQEGLRMIGSVVPGIMNDFTRMLHHCRIGDHIHEEYRFEDGYAVVSISGRRVDGSTVSYDFVNVVKE